MDAALFIDNDDLDSAFQLKEFAALFQPVVSLGRLRAVQASTSLQWHHPALGVLDQPMFMELITDLGRRRELTLHTLRAAVRACAQWRREGLDWSVSARITPSEFLDGDLVTSISQILSESNLNPADLTIDLRETELVGLVSQLLPTFTELRTLGCGLSLHTGASLSSFQDIRVLPLTELIITGGATLQFIQRTRQAQYGLFAERLAEADASGIRAVAAGVEDEATLWAIQRAGFAAATGNYICRPLPQKGLIRWNAVWQQAAEAIAASKRAQQASESPVAQARAPEPEIAPPPQFLHTRPIETPAVVEAPASFADEDIPSVHSPEIETAPAFLHRTPTSSLPTEIDEEFTDEAPAVVERQAPSRENTFEALREALSADEPQETVPAEDMEIGATDESDFHDLGFPEGDAPVAEDLQPESEALAAASVAAEDEDSLEEDDVTLSFEEELLADEASDNAPEPLAAQESEPASRIDLSQWISTRSQTTDLAHNPLDDYFDGPLGETLEAGQSAASAEPEPAHIELPPVTAAPEHAALPEDIDDEPPVQWERLIQPPQTAVPEPAPVVAAAPKPALTETAAQPPATDESGEPVLIARKLKGLDKPITMTVQNPGREGLGLKGLFKKRSGR